MWSPGNRSQSLCPFSLPTCCLHVCQSLVHSKCSLSAIPFSLTTLTEFPGDVCLLGRSLDAIFPQLPHFLWGISFFKTSSVVLNTYPLSLPCDLEQVKFSFVNWVWWCCLLALMVGREERIPERHFSQSLPAPKGHLTLVPTIPSGTQFLPSGQVSHQLLVEPAPSKGKGVRFLPLSVSSEIFLIVGHGTRYDKNIWFLKQLV